MDSVSSAAYFKMRRAQVLVAIVSPHLLQTNFRDTPYSVRETRRGAVT